MRLTEVPLLERCRAARLLARDADEKESAELLLAALCPSSRVYFVPIVERTEMAAAA